MKQNSRSPSGFILMAIALVACTRATINQPSEIQSVRARSDEFQRAIGSKDFERVMGIFAPDAVVITPHGPRATGLPELRSLARRLLGLPGLTINWEAARIEVVSATAATEYGSYTLSYDTPQRKIDDAGSYINNWRKIDGQWRVTLHSIVTSRPLP